jgi:hypothetical protein
MRIRGSTALRRYVSGPAGHGDPCRTRVVFHLGVGFDQLVEQHLHVGLVRCRLERAMLALDREHRDRQRFLHEVQLTACKLCHDQTPERRRGFLPPTTYAILATAPWWWWKA